MNFDEIRTLLEVIEKANSHGQQYQRLRDAAAKRLAEIMGELEPKAEPKPAPKVIPITPEPNSPPSAPIDRRT